MQWPHHHQRQNRFAPSDGLCLRRQARGLEAGDDPSGIGGDAKARHLNMRAARRDGLEQLLVHGFPLMHK